MSEWKEFTLADCINKMNQGVNTTTEKVSYTESGIKVIRAKNILDYKIDFEDVVFINKETYDRLSINVKPKKYDVLYTNIGSQLGSAALVTIDDVFITAWNVLRIQTNSGKLSPLYLVYLLNNPNIREDIRGYDSSSTMPFVSGKVLGAMKITIPPLPEQERIGEVLSSLDDKIDLLQRQNKTLEEMAETLFRQWFVEDTSASETTIGEITKITSGKSLHRSQFLEKGTYPIYGSNGIIGWTDNYTFDENLIITGRVGTLGTVKIIDEKCWISDNVLIIKPNSELYKYPIYFSMKDYDFESLNVGSTQPLLTQGELNKQLVVILDEYKLLSFKQYFDELFNKIKLNLTQIQQLETLRDTLLPKLMSGEVRVSA